MIIELGDTIDEATHRRVRAACARLTSGAIPGLVECVPAFASVAVHYDPRLVPSSEGHHASPASRLSALVERELADLNHEAVSEPRTVEIPVCYGGAYGPDLEDVARQHSLTTEEVVCIHSSGDYLVYMLGFMPGFAYLGGLSPKLATPRRLSPRTVVPAGSVGIGGVQTGVYPLASPGGWNLIGRSPSRLFDVKREPPSLLSAGDHVRFRPIAEPEFDALAQGT